MPQSPTLVILAAGAGSRYGGLKQLAAMGPNGEALLEYAAYDAARVGFGKVVLVVRPDTEARFREHLDQGLPSCMPVSYVHQQLDDLPEGCETPTGRTRPWGTGHAVLAAAPAISEPFAVINADDFYGLESFAALARFFGRASADEKHAVVGFRLNSTLTDAGPVSRALCDIDDGGHLRDISEIRQVWRNAEGIVCLDETGEKRGIGATELVSMNMWGFTPALVPELDRQFRSFLATMEDPLTDEFLLPDVVRSVVLAASHRVEVLGGGGRWFGITFRQDEAGVRAALADLVERGCYPPKLWTCQVESA